MLSPFLLRFSYRIPVRYFGAAAENFCGARKSYTTKIDILREEKRGRGHMPEPMRHIV